MPRILRIRRANDRAARPATGSPVPSLPEAGHLADVLSHRLRGLVSGIMGYTDLLLEQLGPQGQRELAMRIMESAQRIEHVLADFKHYTRQVEPHPEELSVGDLLEDLIKRLPDEIAERIRPDIDGAAGAVVRADRYMARDILMLLLHNAVEATRGSSPIDLTVTERESMIHFDVTNEGGLDAEARERMFEPFFTTKARNLGVGLPLARRLARLQGGEISTVGNDGDGSVTFRFEVPKAPR